MDFHPEFLRYDIPSVPSSGFLDFIEQVVESGQVQNIITTPTRVMEMPIGQEFFIDDSEFKSYGFSNDGTVYLNKVRGVKHADYEVVYRGPAYVVYPKSKEDHYVGTTGTDYPVTVIQSKSGLAYAWIDPFNGVER